MTMSARSMLGGLLCMAWLHAAAPAGAQDGDRALAEALFRKGREAMAASDYPTACAAFEESNRLEPAPGTMVNLATCEESRGRLAAAWQWLGRAVEKLPPTDDRRKLLVERASALEARLPLLTLRLEAGADAGTRVLCDAVELRSASLGLPLPLDPGAHRVTVSAPGRAEKRYAIELRESERKELRIAPGPALSEAPRPHPVGPAARRGPASAGGAPGSGTRTLGYVIGGVGVAGIATGLVFGGLVLDRKSTVASHCDTSPRTCDETGLDAVSSGRTFSTVSTVSFAAGAVATGVGAYLVLSSGSAPETAVGAALLPGGGGVRVVRELF